MFDLSKNSGGRQLASAEGAKIEGGVSPSPATMGSGGVS